MASQIDLGKVCSPQSANERVRARFPKANARSTSVGPSNGNAHADCLSDPCLAERNVYKTYQ
jgi:hypothetical protein